MPKQPLHFRSGSTGLPRRLRRGEAAKRITKPADLMRKAPPKRGFNCPHACRRYSPHSHNVEPGRRFDELGRILRQAFRLRPSRLTLASWPRPRSVSRRPPSGSRSRCEPPCAVQPNRSPPRRSSGEVLLRAAANRCCVGLSTQKPTERVGVERWVCHLPGKPDRSNLAPLRRGFFCRYPRASGRRAGAGQIVRALQKLTARPVRLNAACRRGLASWHRGRWRVDKGSPSASVAPEVTAKSGDALVWTPRAVRPRAVIRSASAPWSSSRRQTGSVLPAGTSSTKRKPIRPHLGYGASPRRPGGNSKLEVSDTARQNPLGEHLGGQSFCRCHWSLVWSSQLFMERGTS